jgi:hypothetical protein
VFRALCSSVASAPLRYFCSLLSVSLRALHCGAERICAAAHRGDSRWLNTYRKGERRCT